MGKPWATYSLLGDPAEQGRPQCSNSSFPCRQVFPAGQRRTKAACLSHPIADGIQVLSFGFIPKVLMAATAFAFLEALATHLQVIG